MTAQIETASQIRATSDCVAHEISGETVLLHLTRGTYFGLDRTGSLVWELITDGTDFDTLVEDLSRRFQRDPAGIATDMRVFLGELLAHDLILLNEESGSP